MSRPNLGGARETGNEMALRGRDFDGVIVMMASDAFGECYIMCVG